MSQYWIRLHTDEGDPNNEKATCPLRPLCAGAARQYRFRKEPQLRCSLLIEHAIPLEKGIREYGPREQSFGLSSFLIYWLRLQILPRCPFLPPVAPVGVLEHHQGAEHDHDGKDFHKAKQDAH